ncbi:glucitol operon activator protein [Enterococcus sp. PF1-24]|uniref:transcriptional regulator GutM n=1 Tax=unclassified Enterococcus TaxID=2608891 RepID=UPI0024765227|nr:MULTISPECIES: transcriptional regulator GutM [unclassified Enterococcus]MDH6363240.1 glucitol operon activator protein [Enterococcus sp. PFB1-1]MDH6400459.1 glucitol operon activator protein [Enterococcus sp. PF1-24]
MSFIYVFGFFAVIAYIAQIIFGIQQIKHFNKTYQVLRKQGKVAIGKRPGKIRAGIIVMFAVDDKGIILDCVKMQGVTVLTKFKKMPEYIGEDIHYLDKYHPIVRQQNKLIVKVIENAREIYLRVAMGNYVEEQPVSTFSGLMTQVQGMTLSLKKSKKRY